MRPLAFSFLAALACCSAAAPAQAAFDTWTFPGPPLPLKLEDVAYARPDRRDAVVEAIRELAAEQLRASGVFRANAPHGVRVELREVKSTARVDTDGAGLGRTDILYRVVDDRGRVLFNDRISTAARVGVAESVGLQQSTERAARYRAFVRNLETFALRLWQGVMPSDGDGARIDAIALAHPLETQERTADFTNRIRSALDVLVPRGSDSKATGLVLAVEGLDFRALAAPADRTAAEVKLALILARADGTPVWQGSAQAKAEISRSHALAAGLLPIDTALADATQAALAKVAPEIGAAMAEAADLDAIAAVRTLPYRLADIVAGPNLAAPDLLQRLRRWNQGNQPLTRVWQEGKPPLTIRLDAARAQLRKTGRDEGVAEIAATYTVLDAKGTALLSETLTTRTAFAADDARLRGVSTGDWAVRVGLRKNWAALLDAIATLPAR